METSIMLMRETEESERAMQGTFKCRNDTMVDRMSSLIGRQHKGRVQRETLVPFSQVILGKKLTET